MSTFTSTFVEEFRRPEYTGENRCVPCTVANVAIAVVVSTAVGVVAAPLGLLLFAVSLAAIYLRGYLVPGTPELTKRYFPDWLLAKFDKDPRMDRPASERDAEPEPDALDAERVLRNAGAIVVDDRRDDVVLDPAFERSWFERMDRLDDTRTDVDELAELLEIDDPDRLGLEWHGDAVVAYLDDRWIGQWESRAAFVADLAGARELDARYDGWSAMSLAHRSEVLGGLRLCLDRCPACGGAVTIHQDVVESCCRSKDVVAATCERCDARLFEADLDAAAFEQAA
jgi:hypothetical protein